ncbi:hypothetical protein HDC90_001533 [Pedobacter sp. AK013]|uniref:hypothetical protein n=1 Tax=Pedobacter sp. AK013 TaxID=2723071 RepID=UPI0016189C47|nr:hypothetical protein [Pedobacter sp. AK013]MBB6236916.1 hypothetical protein [Pedobacter sp. AK013]
MKNFLKALQAKNAEKKGTVNEVNETLFFTENNVNGFFSKEDFANYFNASSDSERDHLDKSLDAISEGAKLNEILKSSFDKNDGHEIMWLKAKFPNADLPPMRILFDDRMLRFFKTYQKSELRFNLSLEKLLIIAGVIPVEEQA